MGQIDEYALVGGKVVDVVAGAIRDGEAILVSNGMIKWIGPEAQLSPDVHKVSVGGRYLSPGLIDCHAHVFIGQFNDHDQVLASEMSARAGNHLKGILDRGFTTIRDAGGADQGHRAAVEKGLWAGPRMFVAGRILSQTGGHGDHRGRADTCACASHTGGAIIADGVDQVRCAVRENVRQGVDQIKIMAGGGVSSPGDKLIHPQYSIQEIETITEEAERVGRYVMAHVYADVGIRRAVEAGVRTIEHGNFLTASTARVMAERDAHLVPTLITYEADGKYGMSFGWAPENAQKNSEVLASGLKSLEVALAEGVNVGYGTDLCWSPKTYQGDGLLIHQQVCGAVEALRHATVNNARIVRMDGQIGQLIEGAYADILLVDANPYDGLECFAQYDNKVVGVIQSGRAVRDDLSLFA